MKDTPTRIFTVMCGLVAVWTAVYWFYKPGEPPVTFDERVGLAATQTDQPAGKDASSRPTEPVASSKTERPTLPAKSKPSDQLPSRSGTDKSARSTPPAPQGDHVVPPKFREYVVQQGDVSYEAIAQRVYNDRKQGPAIAKANPFVNPHKLLPGRTVLRIPLDTNNIQGVVIHEPPPEKDAAKPTPAKAVSKDEKDTKTAHVEKPADAPADTGETEYTVKSEDTLSSIAKAHYGKSAMWQEIYEANKDQIPDPDRLKVGITIRLPKK